MCPTFAVRVTTSNLVSLDLLFKHQKTQPLKEITILITSSDLELNIFVEDQKTLIQTTEQHLEIFSIIGIFNLVTYRRQ